jgi:hypothetical protein
MGGQAYAVVVHAEMCQAAFEGKQGFFGATVVFVLVFGVGDVLPGKLVFQFQGDNGHPVEKDGHIDGVAVEQRVVQLPYHGESILGIALPVLTVHCRFRLEVAQLEVAPPCLYAIAQGAG